jgi:hypothetical protein
MKTRSSSKKQQPTNSNSQAFDVELPPQTRRSTKRQLSLSRSKPNTDDKTFSSLLPTKSPAKATSTTSPKKPPTRADMGDKSDNDNNPDIKIDSSSSPPPLSISAAPAAFDAVENNDQEQLFVDTCLEQRISQSSRSPPSLQKSSIALFNVHQSIHHLQDSIEAMKAMALGLVANNTNNLHHLQQNLPIITPQSQQNIKPAPYYENDALISSLLFPIEDNSYDHQDNVAHNATISMLLIKLLNELKTIGANPQAVAQCYITTFESIISNDNNNNNSQARDDGPQLQQLGLIMLILEQFVTSFSSLKQYYPQSLLEQRQVALLHFSQALQHCQSLLPADSQ